MILAESKNFKIFTEHETVFLQRYEDEYANNIKIGDFYGEAECALISHNEEYAVIAGYGIIIYFLKEPFATFEYDKISDQYIEMFRTEKTRLWIHSIFQTKEDQNKHCFRFTTTNNEDEKETYILNIKSLFFEKILDN